MARENLNDLIAFVAVARERSFTYHLYYLSRRQPSTALPCSWMRCAAAGRTEDFWCARTLCEAHFTRSTRTVTGPGLSNMETSPVT